MRVGAVGTKYPTDVLGGEGLPELLGLPELGRDLGRGDELVTGSTLAAGALALGVVLRQVRATAAVVVAWWAGCHERPFRFVSVPGV
jgi:hypothetical protein